MKSAANEKRIAEFLGAVTALLAEKHGVNEYITLDESYVFSGSLDNPELLLTVYNQSQNGKPILCADIDDEVSWSECDFESLCDFISTVAEYIAARANRTVKTVTIKKKHRYIKFISYYLSPENKWIKFEEDTADNPLLRLFITKDSKKHEIKTYKLKNNTES